MEAGCGPKRTSFAGPYFGSLCPTPKTHELSPAAEVTLSRKRAKSQTRGRKLVSAAAKARGARARKTRADLERQLKACRQKIAHARERLAEATMQQTATSEMLRLISNSPIQSVLDAVAEHAARLCDASNARIWRLEDNLLQLVASYGESLATMDGREGLPADRDTATGRAACDRRTIHVHDIDAEDGEFPLGSRLVKGQGWHTTLATPLLREGTSLGTILVRRTEVRPFSDKQIALLETFADQAVIAIENVRLFEAEKQRTQALAHANRDLADREARIRRLVDSNIIGIFIWDFDGRILEANDAFLRMVNYDREDLVSGHIYWSELTPPDWRERNNVRIEKQRSSGHFPPFEKEYTRKDGTRVPVLMGGAIFEEGGNQGMAYVLDLTARKRSDQALRESEGRFRDFAETASDWFWEMGPDYKFTLLTENAFGSNPAHRIGAACWDHALDIETEPEKWRLVRATLDSHQPFRDFVYCAGGGDGSPMYVRASGKPVFDALGRFCGYRGTGTDVTVLIRAGEEHERLRQLESDLAHTNRLSMMGELAASLAHEIAQPIATARNNARAALNFSDRSSTDLGQVMEALAAVVDDTDRAGEILDRIRDHIKKAPPRKGRVDLNQAITDVIALAQGAIVRNGVSVQTRLAEGLSHVQADRVQVQQVVLNLILNAVEAMSLFKKGVRELAISTEQHETGSVLVAVRDSGPGIDPRHLDRVFDAFYTTKSSGVGIGLSICRSIINAHGGQLWADVNAPRGAVFRFTLTNVGESS
jgi:PAS domain S-box-containing protein